MKRKSSIAQTRHSPTPLRRSGCVVATAVLILAAMSGCESFEWAEVTSEADTLAAGGASSPGPAGVGAGPAAPTVAPSGGRPQQPPAAGAADGLNSSAGPPAAEDAPIFPIGTAPELALLGAGLVVPVSGVTRAQLRDSYTEARGARVHEALDILAPRGTPVLSAADGRLLRLFDSRAGGLMVYATDRSERFILLYGHLNAYADGIRDGMPLTRGQLIGYVGTTGNAAPDTPHLHFGILRGNPAISWSEGSAVNPFPLLAPPRPDR